MTFTGNNLISTGADGQILLWADYSSRIISRHSVFVSAAGISVSGRRVACGSAGVWVFDLDTSSETPGQESISLSDPPIGLIDAPVVIDTIGRGDLADELAFLCRRTTEELSRQWGTALEDIYGYMIHVGGAWGSGKTSIAQMIVSELTNRDRTDPWTGTFFNAWQHEQSEPLLELLQHLDDCTSATKSGPGKLWSRIRRFWIIRPGLARSLFFGVLIIVAVAYALHAFLNVLLVAPAKGNHGEWALNAESLAALLGIGGALLAAASFLAGRARLVLRGISYTGPADRDAYFRDYEASVLRRLPNRLVIVVNEIDRCEPGRVIEVLRACNRLMLARPKHSLRRRMRRANQGPTLAIILLSEREWLFNAIEASYASQQGTWRSNTKRLGSYFMEKLALVSFDLPILSASARVAFIASATGEGQMPIQTASPDPTKLAMQPAETHALAPGSTSPAATSQGSFAATASGSNSSPTILQPALSSTGDPKNAELVKRFAEIERRMRVERRYIMQYSSYLGENPREIKRVLIRYWLDRVVALSEGRDVVQFAEAILFESIVTVRWPVLYPVIRRRKPGEIISALAELRTERFEELQHIAETLDSAWTVEVTRSSVIPPTVPY